jgi:hypothetical protein
MGPRAHMDVVVEVGINSCSCWESNSAVVQPMLHVLLLSPVLISHCALKGPTDATNGSQ